MALTISKCLTWRLEFENKYKYIFLDKVQVKGESNSVPFFKIFDIN
jgi:hypothetical protein